MKQIHLLKLSQGQSVSIFLARVLLDTLNGPGQSNASTKLINMVATSWSLAMALQMWPHNSKYIAVSWIQNLNKNITNAQILSCTEEPRVQVLLCSTDPAFTYGSLRNKPSALQDVGLQAGPIRGLLRWAPWQHQLFPVLALAAHGRTPAPSVAVLCHPPARRLCSGRWPSTDGGVGLFLLCRLCCKVVTGEVTRWRFTVSVLRIRTRRILFNGLGSQARPRRTWSLSVWLLQGPVFWVD